MKRTVNGASAHGEQALDISNLCGNLRCPFSSHYFTLRLVHMERHGITNALVSLRTLLTHLTLFNK